MLEARSNPNKRTISNFPQSAAQSPILTAFRLCELHIIQAHLIGGLIGVAIRMAFFVFLMLNISHSRNFSTDHLGENAVISSRNSRSQCPILQCSFYGRNGKCHSTIQREKRLILNRKYRCKSPIGGSVSFMDIEKKERRKRVRFRDGITNPDTIVSA